MIAIKATLLLVLATRAFAAAYSPYYDYRVSYGRGSPFGAYPLPGAPAVVSAPVTGIQGYPAAPATFAAYHASPTGVHTYHSTPAAVRAVPSYSAYSPVPGYSRFHQGAHTVVPQVFQPTSHAVPAAGVTKFAPTYSNYPSAAFPPVPKVNNVNPYQAAPGVVSLSAPPSGYVYQPTPVLSHPYHPAFLPFQL
ncbi:uncharacterized protein LOC144158321 [Haemaphysalis longicornis]